MEAYKQEFIKFMVESDVLKFGEFTLKSGRKSPFFMNAGAYVTGYQLKKLGEFYARAIHTDIVDLEGIAEHMCRHNCSYSKGQIIGLLDDMVGCIREICLDGNAVKLPDFAIFKPGIRTKGAKTAKDFTATENVLRTYIKIIPTGAMHLKNGYNYAGDVKFKRVKLYDKDKAHGANTENNV